MSNFGKQLRKIRKERSLRQQDLANIINVAQTTIANYEQGIRFPDEETLNKLADNFGVSMDFLLGKTDHPSVIVPASVNFLQWNPILLSQEQNQFIQYVFSGDSEKAFDLLKQFEEREGVLESYCGFLQPVFYEVGKRWENGELDVSEEHFFTETVRSMMGRLFRNTSERNTGPVFLGFSLDGEFHNIGIKMVCDILSLRGFRSYYLGGYLPLRHVLKAVRSFHADVIGISVTSSYLINDALNFIYSIQKSDCGKMVKIIVGGQAFIREEGLWKRTKADCFVSSGRDAPEKISELLV